MRLITIIVCLLLVYSACDEQAIAKPRPRQYPRIDFPETSMITVSEPSCPFTMELPEYAKVVMRPSQEDDRPVHPCWFDLDIDQLGAVIHCSYYPIDHRNTLDDLREDAFTMASKHNVKASFRDEIAIETSQGSKGIIFKIEGPVATPYQFFISDDKKHFLRGSLYFKNRVELDSVAPVIDFLREDINEIVGSVKWLN